MKSARYGDDKYMTQEACCDALKALGAREYPHMDRERYGTRAFQFPVNLEGPDDDHNDRPPGLHVEVYADMQNGGELTEMGVEFKLFGAKNRAMQCTLHSVRRYEAAEMVPKARAVMQALWLTFAKVMEE